MEIPANYSREAVLIKMGIAPTSPCPDASASLDPSSSPCAMDTKVAVVLARLFKLHPG